ncbi:cupredoxin domain-containing protein [Nicoliella lavandulae]|uniref:Cupredoxin domain-containing protein n=1 Tax=Nicoliella lavandulae TaxID=3082954 RepID=A0ABU8SJF2_9LACO
MQNDKQVVTVTVNGGYQPNVVTFKQGQPAAIKFIRTSDQGCLGTVQSNDFNFKRALPLNEAETMPVDTSKAGEYGFSCGMDMVKGRIVIQ